MIEILNWISDHPFMAFGGALAICMIIEAIGEAVGSARGK